MAENNLAYTLAAHVAAPPGGVLEAATHGHLLAREALLRRTDVAFADVEALLASVGERARLEWAVANTAPGDDIAAVLGTSFGDETWRYVNAVLLKRVELPDHVAAHLFGFAPASLCLGMLCHPSPAPAHLDRLAVRRLVEVDHRFELGDVRTGPAALELLCCAPDAPDVILGQGLHLAVEHLAESLLDMDDPLSEERQYQGRLAVAAVIVDRVTSPGASSAELVSAMEHLDKVLLGAWAPAPRFLHAVTLAASPVASVRPAVREYIDRYHVTTLTCPTASEEVEALVRAAAGDRSALLELAKRLVPFDRDVCDSDGAMRGAIEHVVQLAVSNPACDDEVMARFAAHNPHGVLPVIVGSGRTWPAALVAHLVRNTFGGTALLALADDPQRCKELMFATSRSDALEVKALAELGWLVGSDVVQVRADVLVGVVADSVEARRILLPELAALLGPSPARWQLFCELGDQFTGTVGALLDLLDATDVTRC